MTANELIVALCQEAGDDVTDEADVIYGWRSNHCACCEDRIDAAAANDVAALVAIRSCMGLRIIF